MSEGTPALHLVDRGSGLPEILFVHGFASSSRLWAEVIDRLETSHRCVAPDLRGFGRSPEGAGDYSIDTHASDLAEVARASGLSDFVLVGHSMGGKIATALASRRPAGLRALVLLASSPPTPEPISDADRSRALDGYGDRRTMEATVARISRRPLSAQARAAFVEDNLLASRSAWRWWLEVGSRETLPLASLSGLTPPRVIAGEEDPVLPMELQTRLALHLQAAPPEVFQGSGHLIPGECPDRCAEILRETCAYPRGSAA